MLDFKGVAIVFLVKSSMLTMNPPSTQIINHQQLPLKKNADFPYFFIRCSNGGRRWGWHSSLGGLCQQCCRDLGQMVRRGETHLVTWLAVQFEVPTKKNTESGFFSTKFDTFVGKAHLSWGCFPNSRDKKCICICIRTPKPSKSYLPTKMLAFYGKLVGKIYQTWMVLRVETWMVWVMHYLH